MPHTIYVANLPADTQEAEVRELFTPYGPVSQVRLVREPKTGTFRGFAFVDMEDPESVNKALHALRSTTIGGYHLFLDASN
jgi:RNA recognition motif-containing protein